MTLEMIRLVSNGKILVVNWNNFTCSKPLTPKQNHRPLASYRLCEHNTAPLMGCFHYHVLRAEG